MHKMKKKCDYSQRIYIFLCFFFFFFLFNLILCISSLEIGERGERKRQKKNHIIWYWWDTLLTRVCWLHNRNGFFFIFKFLFRKFPFKHELTKNWLYYFHDRFVFNVYDYLFAAFFFLSFLFFVANIIEMHENVPWYFKIESRSTMAKWIAYVFVRSWLAMAFDSKWKKFSEYFNYFVPIRVVLAAWMCNVQQWAQQHHHHHHRESHEFKLNGIESNRIDIFI